MMDPVLRNVLLLYAGLLLINAVLTATLWVQNRDSLFRSLFFVWASTCVSFGIQGALQQTALLRVLGFSSVFPVNLALAYLLGQAVDVKVAWRTFAAIVCGAVAIAVIMAARDAAFWLIALPVAIGVCLPTTVTALRVIATHWKRLTVAGKTLALSSLVFAAHNLDYAFLRDKPEFATLGFTIATLIIFLLSISGPAVALEIVTQRQARVAAELEAARRIQSMILPRELRIPGLDVVGHMRPADSVGGDYYDVCRSGDDCWILLGDVTGHGLGAGLVMLMAQSTMSAIVQARPEISPRELNHLANRVLFNNLARLDEHRHMTIVAMRCHRGNFVISGSHDDVLLWRAATQTVEVIPLAHFPWGLGFIDFEPSEVREHALSMSAGDLLFVGTDGVVEAARGGDPRRGVFGEKAIVEVLTSYATAPLEELKRRLLSSLEEFTRGVYHDDVAFLLVRANGAAS
jgi:serine phosphatase RsbU (regulator of sigma subunit)